MEVAVVSSRQTAAMSWKSAMLQTLMVNSWSLPLGAGVVEGGWAARRRPVAGAPGEVQCLPKVWLLPPAAGRTRT